MRQGILERYAAWLPVTEHTPRYTLFEGNTPLIHAPALSEELGVDLWLKWEGANPTGSFKDRGMVMAINKAKEEGSRAVICASTGNTSASAAAYAARAGMNCFVVVPAGHIALGKLSQAIMYGAEVIAIDENFDQALELVREIAVEENVTLVNSVNPHRIEGQKTAAFEVCEQLGDAPDILAIPVGNAGNISAYWKGFQEWKEAGNSTRLPRMWGFEAEGAAAIVRGEPITEPETVATAIRIGNPASWKTAVRAAEESEGMIGSVTDGEILSAFGKVARQEGVFCEPASAASVAGVIRMHREGMLPKGARVVCVLTGNGLKDPDTALGTAVAPATVPCDKRTILDIIRGK
ncbi:threonine synthase [Staphylospora marina]|uniref:threonine synthase n=1 Tax=Staphylospora marina TaxID=2490858 RepID=UPI000F5BF6BB|nr:threonine synthase [Staphylospora marina]